MKTALGLFLAIIVSTLSVSANCEEPQQEEAKIRAVGDQYFEAIKSQELKKCANLMHPDVLTEFKDVYVKVVEGMEDKTRQDELLSKLKAVESLKQLKELSPQDFFAALMAGTDEGTINAMKDTRFEYLGIVKEGDQIAHVLYRLHMTVRGAAVTALEVISMCKKDNNWRMLLSSNLGIIQSMLKKNVKKE